MSVVPVEPPGLDHRELAGLLDRQDDVVPRRELQRVGAADHDLARLFRRRDLSPVRASRGVRRPHRPAERPAARLGRGARLLARGPQSPVRATAGRRRARPRPGGTGARRRGRRRTVHPLPGVRVHRMAHLDDRVDWLRSAPRVRLPDAVIDVCLAHPEPLTCFRILADACQTRLTTPDHLAAALSSRARVTGRTQLRDLIDDLRTGACSVLERGYLALERRHGLPAADRQRADLLPSGRVYRDVPYSAYGVLVELDGRVPRQRPGARPRPKRDLDTQATSDGITVRLGVGQVFDRGCATIARVAALLTRRDWPGPFRSCPGCR